MVMSKTVKLVVVFGLAVGLLLPGLYLAPRETTPGKETPPYMPPTPDQPSNPLANQQVWEDYAGSAGEWPSGLNESLFTKNVTLEELRVLASEEARKVLEGSAGNASAPPSPMDTRQGAIEAPGTYDASKDGGTAKPRDVEEADIVKLQGSYLFVLNPYRGLLIIDLGVKDSPKVVGSARLQGYPKDMYVVGNLAFVILSSDYGYWYSYYTRGIAQDASVAVGGVDVTVGTHVAVINLKDKAAPRVVMRIPLPGFASDSRRVGDVIYAVTNTYDWYWYGSNGGGTYVTSVDFTEPSRVRRVETLFFNGTSNQVHASPTAFFIAQPYYWSSRDERASASTYQTNMTYIDISDPRGVMRARDAFAVAGQLSDKYQMDHYKNTFRIVTHFFGFSGELGSSTLTIWNVGNPDDITLMGSLDIKDAGTLMATRFAGERAYTIHLPRSVDPLDVLDLSDPAHPRLTAILEMPGWVTHIEVRGMKLMALGVDDSSGMQKVAVSLFDVANPVLPILRARVAIGSGYSWSEANWEPKALTVMDEQGLVVVPFSSYDYTTSRDGKQVQGVQLVKFDLARGTLAARGAVTDSYPLSRTRAYGDRILATSDRALLVIDYTDLSRPEVTARLEFAVDVADAIRQGQGELQLVSDGYGDEMRLRYVAAGPSEWAAPLSEVKLSLRQASLYTKGSIVYILGVEGLQLKVLAYDYSIPSDPKLISAAGQALPAESSYEYGAPKERMGGGVQALEWYGSLSASMLDNDVLAVLPEGYYFYSTENKTLYLFDLSNPGRPSAVPPFTFQVGAGSPYRYYYYTYGMMASGRTLYLSSWGYQSSLITRIDLTQPSRPAVRPELPVQGQLVGAEPDGSALYTTSSVYYPERFSTFNVYMIEGEGARLAYAVEFNLSITSARVAGGKAYLTLGTYQYYYHDAPGYRVEGFAPGDGSSSGGTPQPETVLAVLLLELDGARLVGKVGLDGWATIQEAGGRWLFLTTDGALAAYDISTDTPRFAGGLTLRGYINRIRPFEQGAVISEGLYGTETLSL